MKLVRCQSADQIAHAVLSIFTEATKNTQGRLKAFLPTGQSPLPFYKLLQADKSFWSERLFPIQIDEFVDRQRLFYNQLNQNILLPLDLGRQCAALESEWSDVQLFGHIAQVCGSGIDISLLGLGPNGHIGFHEPGPLGVSFLGGRVQITDQTRNRVEGAKTNEVMTFGAGSFLLAKAIILIATGSGKREVFNRFLNSEPTPLLPASMLKAHQNLVVVTDL